MVAQLTLDLEGIVGDDHRGPTLRAGVRQRGIPRGTIMQNVRQVSLVSREELAAIVHDLQPGELFPTDNSEAWRWLGANICTNHLEALTQLPPETRLVFPSGCTLIVTGENEPCRIAGAEVAKHLPGSKIASKFVKVAHQKRGVVAWVKTPGTIALNDEITVVLGRTAS